MELCLLLWRLSSDDRAGQGDRHETQAPSDPTAPHSRFGFIRLCSTAHEFGAFAGGEDSTVSHGGPVEDYVSLIDSLRAAGAEVEPDGPMSQVFLSVAGQIIRVNGEDVQVYEYPDEATADADVAQIPPDGTSFRTVMVTWIAPPHFFRTGRLIVLYVGSNTDVLTALESVLGPQFAGG